MELSDVRAFARTAEMGGVSAAARSLGLPKSTISRSLARLERVVGTTLVDRSTRHSRLTDAGVLFRPYAARILADVDEAGTALDNFTGVPRGTLRVSAPFTFVTALVAPMLPAFIARYPQIRIVVDVENRVIDLPVEPADVVIRVGPLADSDLIARHLLTTEAWTCASPAYIASHGEPACVKDLYQHSVIAYADRPAVWSFRHVSGTIEQVEIKPAHAVSDSLSMKPMLVGGGGIGRLPDFIARHAVAANELVRLFAHTQGDWLDVHALYTSHRSLSAKVRVFIDALCHSLAAGPSTD